MTAALAPVLMNADEARACVSAINNHFDGARALLLALYEREGWRALGFESWRACVVACFKRSQSYLYYELNAARTERELSTIVESPEALPHLREYHLRQIAELPPADRREVALSLARKELTSEQHRQLIAERSAARPARQPQTPGAVSLPEAIDIRRADAASLPWATGSVDLVVTSPPYNLGMGPDGEGDDLPYFQYLERARAWAREMFRVSGPRGRLCLNVAIDTSRGGQQHSLYADWVHELEVAGWLYNTTIVWADNDTSRHTARGGNSPSAVHVMTPVEVIIVLYKGEWHLDRVGAHDLEHEEWIAWTHGLWTFPNNHSAQTGHPCPYPLELPRRCIKLFSFRDAVVCDPFLGSGTTAVAAAQLGRRVLASEIRQAYVDMARARVTREAL